VRRRLLAILFTLATLALHFGAAPVRRRHGGRCRRGSAVRACRARGRLQGGHGPRVKVAYGSSGNFTQQIENGAPFELFLPPTKATSSALREGPDRDAGVLYAIGRIVLFVPTRSPLQPDPTLATARSDRRRPPEALRDRQPGARALRACRARGIAVRRALDAIRLAGAGRECRAGDAVRRRRRRAGGMSRWRSRRRRKSRASAPRSVPAPCTGRCASAWCCCATPAPWPPSSSRGCRRSRARNLRAPRLHDAREP